jgi:hypothetical protein
MKSEAQIVCRHCRKDFWISKVEAQAAYPLPEHIGPALRCVGSTTVASVRERRYMDGEELTRAPGALL